MKPLSLSGRVVKGEGMAGSILNCPTANIALEQGGIVPAVGVYIGETEFDGFLYPSLVCISDGRTGSSLKMEVHLIDQTLDLRGTFLKVQLFHKLRDILPYPGDEEMARIIALDLNHARVWFQNNQTGIQGNIPRI